MNAECQMDDVPFQTSLRLKFHIQNQYSIQSHYTDIRLMSGRIKKTVDYMSNKIKKTYICNE